MTDEPKPSATNPADNTKSAKTSVASGISPSGVWYARPLSWSILLLVLALAAFSLLLFQKWQHEQDIRAEQESRIARIKADNDAMEAYLDRLRALIGADPCAIERELSNITPPEGIELPVIPVAPSRTPRPQADAGHGQPSTTGEPATALPAMAPETGSQAATVPTPSEAKPKQVAPAAPSTTAELLEQGTVLLICQNGDSLSMGSGFFVATDTIMTNAHVVGTARQAIFINKAVGKVNAATVILRTKARGIDFAVLKTATPMPVTPLKLNLEEAKRMQKVSAWGFPGAVSTADPKFRALLTGKGEAAPEVVSSEGSVNVVLDQTPPIIVHSATVSQGNSGGPLANEAGEVIGINSMISLDNQSYRQSSLAIPSLIIARFLEANGIAFSTAGDVTGSKEGRP